MTVRDCPPWGAKIAILFILIFPLPGPLYITKIISHHHIEPRQFLQWLIKFQVPFGPEKLLDNRTARIKVNLLCL